MTALPDLGMKVEAGRQMTYAAAGPSERRMESSNVGETRIFARQFLSGKLEVELTPQGALAFFGASQDDCLGGRVRALPSGLCR